MTEVAKKLNSCNNLMAALQQPFLSKQDQSESVQGLSESHLPEPAHYQPGSESPSLNSENPEPATVPVDPRSDSQGNAGKEQFESQEGTGTEKRQVTADEKLSKPCITDFENKPTPHEEKDDVFVVNGPTSSVTCACSCTKGVMVGLTDGSVILIELQSETLLGKHEGSVRVLSAFSDIVASGSDDKTVKIWNHKTTKVLTINAHTESVTCLSVLPGGQHVVSGSKDHKLSVWSTTDGSHIKTFTEHTAPVICVSFIRDGKILISGSEDKTVKIWYCYTSFSAGKLVVTIGNPEKPKPDEVPVVPNQLDSTIPKPGKQTSPILNYDMTCLSVMREDHIICGLKDGTVRIWKWSDYGYGLNVRMDEIAVLHGGKSPVTCLAVTRDGNYIFSGSEDGVVRLYEWDYWDEKEITSLKKHKAKVTCLLVLPDGKHIASGADDMTVQIWSLEEADSIATLEGYTKQVTCIAAMPPDNMHLVLGSTDGKTTMTNLIAKSPAFCESNKSDQDIKPQETFFKDHETKLMDGETIIPQYVNILHKWAYCSKPDELTEWLKNETTGEKEKGKNVPIIRGIYGSPLTLALLKSTKCVDAILNHLSMKSDVDFAAIQAITEDFPKLLTAKNLHNLVPFFKTLLRKPNRTVPEAIEPLNDLPIALYSVRRDFHVSQFGNEEGTDKEEVGFLVSLFRWNFKQGSEQLLKLLRALEDCEDRKVLTTPVVTSLVESRWETLLVPARLHTAAYIYLLLCLIGIIFNYWNVGTLVEVIFIILNVFFLIFKVAKSIAKGDEYWTDSWYYVRAFGCITSIACLAQYNVEQDYLFVMAEVCFFRGIVIHKPDVPRFIQYSNNLLYLCSLLYLIGMAFNYFSLEILGIIVICLNALFLGINSFLIIRRENLWNHGKVFGCLASIAWGGLVLYGAENLQYLHFVIVCMCSFCCVSFFHQNNGFIVLYICLILCMIEITFNYWSLGVLGLIFICLNAFFLLVNLWECSNDVWSYVDRIQCLVGTLWGFLVYFEVEQSLYSHLVVICMLCLYIVTIPIVGNPKDFLLIYPPICLIGMILNYWSLGIIEIVYIGLNVGFLVYEMLKIGKDGTKHWSEVWSYVNLIQCVTSITWGWLVFFEVESLQYVYVAVVCMSLLRGLEVFKYSEMPRQRYISLVLYICLMLCLVEMTLNPNLETLEVIFICLNALLLIYEAVEICIRGSDYWSDVWNYVALLQCITSSTWGCLLYYQVEHLQYLHLVVLTLCFLRSFTFFHHFTSEWVFWFSLYYLSSIVCMIEMTFHNWSLGIIFICVNGLFLIYEIVKGIPDLKEYWADERNYVFALICLTGVVWGLSVHFEVDQLHYLYFLLVSVIFLRILSFFPSFKMTGYNLLYLGSILCLSGITINYWSITLLEISFICLNVIFLLYEIIQCLANGTDYLLDVWNYVDLTRCVTSIVWGWLMYNDVEGSRYLDFAVVSLCFLRGFTFFRTFKMTRMFVRMVLEVVKDMYSFLVILAFSTCSFGMMYAVLVPGDIKGAPEAWTNAYSLLMGNFSSDEFGVIEWFCFTAASLVNVIIMLNLLISILGKAYEKAEESMKENDTLEMLRLVIEYESMLFWKRKDRESTVMIVCKAAEQDPEDEWTEKIAGIDKVMKDNLTALETKLETKLDLKLKESQKAIEAKLDAKMETVEKSQLEMKTKIDQILAELQAKR